MTLAERRPARARILDAAGRLFYARGVVATGIDAIIAEAGVAKMSLYNNFSSKDELIEAYVEARHAEWRALYERRAASASGPRERALAVFDAYLDHADASLESGFRGCGLLNAAAELPDGSAGRDAVRRHKEEIEGLLAAATGSAELAQHLSFLVEGAVVRAGLEGSRDRLSAARAIAAKMIDAA
ncbi:TetR/AcrR family transcriptional regulator [Microbacterium suaedae]|uniref:TetR/AcrR family transcriptional regulator n=1 Tax=Microbacterium suaedae TaxID=2067813 RepID=UPI000DADF812|nr:TetR/AcrR family transcriptional regulator [Microbacterium suaedae]